MNAKNLVIVIGPPAAGKMAVGLELARLTGFMFMHNYQTIEALLPTLPFGSPSFLKLPGKFRQVNFDEVAASDAPGFIYTTACDTGSSADRAEIDAHCAPFRRGGARVLFTKLSASLETRLAHDRTGLHLQNKASKRALTAPESRLRRIHERIKGVPLASFSYRESHLTVVNDHFAAMEAAQSFNGIFARDGLPWCPWQNDRSLAKNPPLPRCAGRRPFRLGDELRELLVSGAEPFVRVDYAWPDHLRLSVKSASCEHACPSS